MQVNTSSLLPFPLCLKGTIYEKMHPLRSLKAPTSPSNKNLFFFHSADCLLQSIFPPFLPRNQPGGRRTPASAKAKHNLYLIDGRLSVRKWGEKNSRRLHEIPQPRAHPLNLGAALGRHCSIACEMDTLAYFIRGLSQEREDSGRVFSSLPALPAPGPEPITGTIRHKHAARHDPQPRAGTPQSPPAFPGTSAVEAGSAGALGDCQSVLGVP